MRHCCECKAVIRECFGSVLACDFTQAAIGLMPWGSVRELCPKCSTKKVLDNVLKPCYPATQEQGYVKGKQLMRIDIPIKKEYSSQLIPKLEKIQLSIERLKILLTYDRHLKYRKEDINIVLSERRNDFTISKDELEEWTIELENNVKNVMDEIRNAIIKEETK